MKEAAKSNLTQAQAILYRLHGALGVPVPTDNLMIEWLSTAAAEGSIMALTDLRRIDLQSYRSVTNDLANKREMSTNERFREAIRSGDLQLVQKLVSQIDGINCRDHFGATCLFWVSNCLEETAVDIASFLLKKGAHVNIYSNKWVPGSADAEHSFHYLNNVPSRITPVEWAIMQDNVPVMKILIMASNDLDPTFLDDAMGNHPIACASRYQSQKCLSELCANSNPQEVRSFDGYGYSALYYALRADVFDRMLRFPVGDDESELGRGPLPDLPVVERELGVLATVLDSGSGLQVHESDAFTCLHISAAASYPKVFRFMLSARQSADLSTDTPPDLPIGASTDLPTDASMDVAPVVAPDATPNASTDTPIDTPPDILTRMTKDGYTPLKVAIARGEKEIFTAILDKIVNPSDLWCDQRFHAIHLCAMRSKPQSRDFAEILLEKDPRCLHSGSKSRYLSPLHIAAVQGNRSMIDLLILSGADLLRPAERLTPLGLAIRARSLVGVGALGVQHRRQKVPLIAAHGSYRYLLPPIGQPVEALRTIAATTFLLAPGIYSRNLKETIDMSNVPFQKNSYIGCYDHPFSKVSKNILASLLEHYLPGRILGILRLWRHPPYVLSRIIPGGANAAAGFHLLHRIISASQHRYQELDAGLMWSVRMGNLDAVELIMKNRSHCQYMPPLRELVELAYLQSRLQEEHVASEQSRCDVLEYLLRVQKEEYMSIGQRRREKPVLHWYWKAYYSVYGDREQRCFERCHQWELKSRPFFVFGPWCYPRIPLYLLAFCVLWAILIPTARDLSILKHSPAFYFTSKRVAAFVGVVLIVS